MSAFSTSETVQMHGCYTYNFQTSGKNTNYSFTTTIFGNSETRSISLKDYTLNAYDPNNSGVYLVIITGIGVNQNDVSLYIYSEGKDPTYLGGQSGVLLKGDTSGYVKLYNHWNQYGNIFNVTMIQIGLSFTVSS